MPTAWAMVSSASTVKLEADITNMIQGYKSKYDDLLFKYGGDDSKITDEDFKDVIPDEYASDFKVTKEGVEYVGSDEKVKETAILMGTIDKKSNATGEGFILSSTTSSIKVSLNDSVKGYTKYVYYINQVGSSAVVKKESSEKLLEFTKLTDDTEYNIKVEGVQNGSNTVLGEDKKSTEKLLVPSVEIKTANGDMYNFGEWTNQTVYTRILKSQEGVSSLYSVSNLKNKSNEDYTTSEKVETEGDFEVAVSAYKWNFKSNSCNRR